MVVCATKSFPLHALESHRLSIEPDAGDIALAPGHELRVILGEGVKQNSHDKEPGSPHLRHRLPAIGDEDERCEEFRDRGSRIASAEDAKRKALPLPRIPR